MGWCLIGIYPIYFLFNIKVILKHMAPQKLEKADILSNSAFYTGSNIKYSRNVFQHFCLNNSKCKLMSYKQYTSDNPVHQEYHLTCGLQ